MSRSLDSMVENRESVREIDLRTLGATLKRRRRVYLLPTAIAFVATAIFVNVTTPRYTATSQVLLENQENFFTRPDRVNLPPEQAAQLDETAVASQVQLVSSPDIARKAIAQLGLKGDEEFDPMARGMGALQRVLVLLGLTHDPSLDSVDERLTQAFLQKLTVFSPAKTRVITIQFTSRKASLSARAANLVAELYIQEQSAAKRLIAKDAAEALASQILDLRTKLVKADDERERYRLQSGLLAGSNNMTLTGQQLADVNADLSKARGAQAEAQAKASMIRELLRAGKAVDVAEVTNNDIVRRLWDQRATAQAQLALESRSLLPEHPRIKGLTAQVAQYDAALKSAAKQAATTLENEAKIAGTRVTNLETILGQQKKVAGVANADEIRLHALDRTAQSYKDQLESSTAKYQEALARQSSTATPADARIISRATRPQEPSYPKKLPFIAFATIATLVLSLGFIVAGELLSGDAVAEPESVVFAPAPEAHAAKPLRRASDKQPMKFEPSGKARSIQADLFSGLVPEEERGPPAVVQGPEPEPVAKRVCAEGRKTRAAGIVASAVGYLRRFSKSAEASRAQLASRAESFSKESRTFGWEPEAFTADEEPETIETYAGGTQSKSEVAKLTKRIVAAHVPGRGLHVVGTGVGNGGGTLELIALARDLSEKGRAIMVDLNRTPMKLATLTGTDGGGRVKIMTMHGLSDLLAGDSSFAEVISRDHGSRLHFVPTGLQGTDFRDFDLVLDALSETYDFIVLLAPTFPDSEIAKVMAPYADFVVVTTDKDADDDMLAVLERDLIEAGAREVLIADSSAFMPAREQDVA